MRIPAVILLVAFVATAKSSNLLEMSQTLWSKLLEGGLTKIGALDPLRVPVVKVDQAEGNTSYRMILRGVEIIGLNSSSLESVHIGRGRLKTNLTEHEAGYVSYTDQRELDTIRYRFHTVTKEPKGQGSQNLEVLPLERSEGSKTNQNQYGRVRNYDSSRSQVNYQTSSRYQDNRQQGLPQGSRPSSRYQEDQSSHQGPQGVRSNYDSSRVPEVHTRHYSQPQDPHRMSGDLRMEYQIPQRQESSSRFSSEQENTKSPGRVRVVYAERYHDDNSQVRNQGSQDNSQIRNPGFHDNSQARNQGFHDNSQARNQGFHDNSQTRNQGFHDNSQIRNQGSHDNSQVRNQGPQSYSQTRNQGPINGASDCLGSCMYRRNQASSGVRTNQRDEDQKHNRDEDIGVAASMNFESRRAYVDATANHRRDQDDSMIGQHRYNNGPTNGNRYASSFDQKVNEPDNQRKSQRYESLSQTRLENQPGYVDIVYADDKDQKMRRFGNLRVESGRDTTVYSLDDVLRDLRDQRRFIIHNFTEGEALAKKNDAVRTASETKRIKDMVRYARDFQEMQGFYEQGMQLIYHYGDKDNEENIKVKDGQRIKRAHLDDDTEEDDIMHVIMRIRVPMLRVNAGYVLMGKVGKQVLRGNGLLNGNFTELIGDFTLELKKVDEDTMVVRAARARLSAKDKKITLQGMDEEGPVKEILTHGLMAAEAVAAMLADDLATKALSEKTADSIIYRMYKNLPAEN